MLRKSKDFAKFTDEAAITTDADAEEETKLTEATEANSPSETTAEKVTPVAASAETSSSTSILSTLAFTQRTALNYECNASAAKTLAFLGLVEFLRGDYLATTLLETAAIAFTYGYANQYASEENLQAAKEYGSRTVNSIYHCGSQVVTGVGNLGLWTRLNELISKSEKKTALDAQPHQERNARPH